MTMTPERRTATLSASVAEEIRAWLGRRRMSQAQLARTLGQSQMWVSDRLRGIQPISLDDVERIAHVLDVPVLKLLSPEQPNVRLDHPTPFGPQRRDPSRPPGTTGPRQRRPQPVRHAA